MNLKDVLLFWYRRISYVLGDELGYFAAGLSFYTVFSLIPLFWVVFYILSQLEVFSIYYLSIKQFMVANLLPTHTETVSAFLDEFLRNSDNMGQVGLFYVLLASVLFYNNYQYVVDKIFAKVDYSLLHAVRTYFVLAILMPITLAASFYLTDVIQGALGRFGGIVQIYSLLSFGITWLLFLLLFKISPNMRLMWRVVGFVSFLAAAIWQLAKMLFVHYVISNEIYESLYGSFSVLLFLFVWIYFSWYLLLHGLRLCYLLQCRVNARSGINE